MALMFLHKAHAHKKRPRGRRHHLRATSGPVLPAGNICFILLKTGWWKTSKRPVRDQLDHHQVTVDASHTERFYKKMSFNLIKYIIRC